MVLKTIRNEIKTVELYKIINQRKTNNIKKYKLKLIEETLNHGTCMELARKTLGIGRKQLYAFKG